mgnify:CR=1 FL=1
MFFKKFIRRKKAEIFDKMKVENKRIRKDNRGQGAAEYILLFGGVIVIALAGLLIYRAYFNNSSSELNASQDINSIRNNMTSLQVP